MIALYVIFIIAVPIGIVSLRNSFLKFYQTKGIEVTIEGFLEEYEKFECAMDLDCDAENVLKISRTVQNTIQIGLLEDMTFKDSRELRKCFLKAGEFIIQYTEYVKEAYNYYVDQVNYEKSLEILKKIRTICLQKGENSVVYVRNKK